MIASRRDEVAVLARLLAEPDRSRIFGFVDGLARGVFDRGTIADLARANPRCRWPAVLLALETAELLLAGSVRIETPERFFGDGAERWATFRVTVFPEGFSAACRLDRDPRHEGGYRLAFAPESRGASECASVSAAVATLARELAACLGRGVAMVGDRGGGGRG